MKRTSKISITYDSGTKVEVTVSTDSSDLSRQESLQQHDEAVNGCIDAVRSLSFAGNAAGYRSVKLR